MFGAKIAFTYKVHIYGHTVVYLGGVGVRTISPLPSPSGIRTPRHPKVPPLVLFYAIHFRPTKHKIFLRAPLAPTYSKLKDSARRKKRNVFGQKFSKNSQNSFSTCFVFSKICLRPEFMLNRTFIIFWECSESQFGRTKKKIDKYFKHFLKRVCETV